MNALFLGMLSLYLAQSVYLNSRGNGSEHKTPPAAFVLQGPLLLLACWYAWRQGVINRDLVSPVYILGGVVAGHLIFGISLYLTHHDLRDAARHFLDLHSLRYFLVENPMLIFRFVSVSISEELIYRAAAQTIIQQVTDSPALAILIVALGFSMVHAHFFRNPFSQSAEFVAFALLLGALYYWTHSLVLVVVIHTLRNLEIVYLEYLVKLDELGDEVSAMKYIENAYTPAPAFRS